MSYDVEPCCMMLSRFLWCCLVSLVLRSIVCWVLFQDTRLLSYKKMMEQQERVKAVIGSIPEKYGIPMSPLGWPAPTKEELIHYDKQEDAFTDYLRAEKEKCVTQHQTATHSTHNTPHTSHYTTQYITQYNTQHKHRTIHDTGHNRTCQYNNKSHDITHKTKAQHKTAQQTQTQQTSTENRHQNSTCTTNGTKT